MPGFPCCVLSQAFRDKVEEIEDKKQEKRDAIKKHKAGQKAEAEQKKDEKKKAAEAQHKTCQQKVSTSSSENEDPIEYADSSSGMSVDEDKDETLLS